jgi:hypothetical protein
MLWRCCVSIGRHSETGGGYRFHWPIDRNSTVSPRVNQPEHGGAGGPQSSEATRPIAREACHPSLAFYTDTFDRDFTLFFWAMVDGLEIDLALSTNASASVAVLRLTEKGSEA